MICTTPCKILISTTKDDDSGVEERFYQRLILFHFDMNTIKMSVARGGHAPVVMMGKNRNSQTRLICVLKILLDRINWLNIAGQQDLMS